MLDGAVVLRYTDFHQASAVEGRQRLRSASLSALVCPTHLSLNHRRSSFSSAASFHSVEHCTTERHVGVVTDGFQETLEDPSLQSFLFPNSSSCPLSDCHFGRYNRSVYLLNYLRQLSHGTACSPHTHTHTHTLQMSFMSAVRSIIVSSQTKRQTRNIDTEDTASLYSNLSRQSVDHTGSHYEDSCGIFSCSASSALLESTVLRGHGNEHEPIPGSTHDTRRSSCMRVGQPYGHPHRTDHIAMLHQVFEERQLSLLQLPNSAEPTTCLPTV